ncbi:N-acetylglucosamine-6-phosphate deacetylase [Vibrio nitrifigilis]|uniref:N-acetylglucosamine-6-phosphate deacetylase n=1 Tax=Vibrio nitrifigilis TaxID=2789781 RepID=A0ABS0GBN0_9VIBR|nr:N-acetylglucosamine-6-phosphate deacetylase [Vibrio nitrifigilis]MBF8999822.1 N-acetylglucosamine-6-phosphate deacetylase [Vibrio nitrifigilis]
MKYALTNGIVYTGQDRLEGYAVIINNDVITNIVPEQQLPEDVQTIDLEGAIVSPGFIDLQLNGCGGVMFNDDISESALDIMHKANLKSGCTSFLPTFITSPDEDMRQAVETTRRYMSAKPNQVLGLHMEGPYLNPEKKGIHNIDYVRSSNQEMVDYLCKNSDVIAQVTMAPEVNDHQHITQLANANIVVSLGHTNCTYQQAREGFASGMTFATHLFNAMSSIVGREPGAVGAVYDSPDVYTGIIADGFHVDFANIRIAKKIKQDKLILVTDATAPAGAEMDYFIFVGKKVYYRDGKCVDEHGTLGGSALTMMKAIENAVEHVGIALDEALRMATLYPARAIGLDHKLGQIKPGMVANLAIFDRDFTVKATIVNGQYEQN